MAQVWTGAKAAPLLNTPWASSGAKAQSTRSALGFQRRTGEGSFGASKAPHGIQVWSRLKLQRHIGTTLLARPSRTMAVYCATALVTESPKKTEDIGEEKSFSGPGSALIPNAYEVEHLLTQLCDTSIVEFELKLNGFQLSVTRDVASRVENLPTPSPASTSASVAVNAGNEAPSLNGSISTSASSLAIFKPTPSDGKTESFLEKAADGGLVMIHSPKVGFFRRSRTIKGKRAPPSCKEKQMVKEGQVICYIEQLGCEIAVESDVSGEVIKILCDDGEPVGYGDAVIAILPSFPGIKQLAA